MDDRHPITKCRERMKLSQDAFGQLVGVDGMTVSRWERGESLPRRTYWRKLENLVGKPIAEIIAWTKQVAA
jgi:DNA-binding transcriptional regulator YiaG